MADFLQGLDPGKLILGGAVLSFALSPFAAPPYNLPIFLFGLLVYENTDAVQSFKLFFGLLSASILLDIIWAFNNEQSGFGRLLLLLLVVLKFPTAGTLMTVLQQRGSQFMGLGAEVSGPTVWSMPGGFTSGGRDGYQVVADEPRVNPIPRGPAPPPKVTASATITQPAPGASVHPGNYQNA